MNAHRRALHDDTPRRVRGLAIALVLLAGWLTTSISGVSSYQSQLASRVIAETDGTGGADPVERWLAARPRVVERVDQTLHDFRAASSIDLAMLTVASRQLRALVES